LGWEDLGIRLALSLDLFGLCYCDMEWYGMHVLWCHDEQCNVWNDWQQILWNDMLKLYDVFMQWHDLNQNAKDDA